MLSLLFALTVNSADACPMADAEAAAAARAKVEAAEGDKVTFSVEGMSCGSCSAKITATLEGVEGVVAAAVDYQEGTAVVAYDAAKVDQDKLLAAITDLGFAARAPKS